MKRKKIKNKEGKIHKQAIEGKRIKKKIKLRKRDPFKFQKSKT